MKLSFKIFLYWSSTILLYWLSSIFVAGRSEVELPVLLNQFAQVALLFVSAFITLKEPNRKNRFLFLNFTLAFACSLGWMFEPAIIKFFVGSVRYIAAYTFEYISIVSVFLLSLAVIYLVVDLLFNDFKVFQKYLIAFAIVSVCLGFYFQDFLADPLFPYSTPEIKQWKTISEFVPVEGEIPSATVLASKVTLQSWKDGYPVGDLYPEENLKQIEYLLPYLEGENWRVLLWKPLYLRLIYMNVFLIACMIVFFGYQYRKDPPQGAYIDKIAFLLLLVCSMEILHNWGYLKSAEYGSMMELFSIGQYVTVIILLLMLMFFGMRLRFITSVQGEFYETELAANPAQISRWRDWIDNVVLANFFNLKLFNGRLFQNPSGR